MFKHPRKAPANGRRRVVALVVVLLAIGTVFFFLELMKEAHEKGQWSPVPVVEQQHLPQRLPSDYGQGVYTAAQLPAAPVSKPKMARPVKHGSIAIVIDDMGASVKDAERLLAINQPITFAIIPGLAHSRQVAEIAHGKGRGVMIHMPMEPQGYPQQRLEKNGLLLSQSTGDITSRVEAYLKEIPHASGANNHMGSAFTEHEDKMQPVLDTLKRRGMFFIDSRTSSKSVGYALAGRMGMQTGTRNIFLDNDQSVDKVKEQLFAAAGMATKRGSVIAICHPHPGTIQALQELMPELQRQGITFVPAALLVR
jgi:polysaccharide deacetylase 2 family uncharacterized protein YibQ